MLNAERSLLSGSPFDAVIATGPDPMRSDFIILRGPTWAAALFAVECALWAMQAGQWPGQW